MKKEKVIIIGAGGHAKVVIDAMNKADYSIFGILDKDEKKVGQYINGIKVIGSDKMVEELYKQGITNAIIAIGQLGNHELRENLFCRMKKIGFCMINVIHSRSCIAKNVVLGEGNVVLANAIINADVVIGNNNIINTSSIVEHDVKIGSNVHMAPGAIICGMSTVKDNTLIGAGATIIQGIDVGANVVVGAGSTVLEDISDNNVVVGTPAKCIRRK